MTISAPVRDTAKAIRTSSQWKRYEKDQENNPRKYTARGYYVGLRRDILLFEPHLGRDPRDPVTLPAIALIQKLWRLPWRDLLLLLEATIWLAVAGVSIALLPFRYVGCMAALPVRRQAPPPHKRLNSVERVRWAIVACARRVPWRAMCFEQGLAAQFMLRRRGMPSILYYGAAPDDQKGLAAHVWVRDGDIEVIGCDIASRFAVLATFPPNDGLR